MALPIVEAEPPLGFFDPARDSLLRNYKIHSPKERKPRIIYIDRQSTDRRLPDATNFDLLETCREIAEDGQAVFDHIVLEELTGPQQIAAVAFADVRPVFLSFRLPIADVQIMVGIHGNGLTHELWMPQNSTVIEVSSPPHTLLPQNDWVYQFHPSSAYNRSCSRQQHLYENSSSWHKHLAILTSV